MGADRDHPDHGFHPQDSEHPCGYTAPTAETTSVHRVSLADQSFRGSGFSENFLKPMKNTTLSMWLPSYLPLLPKLKIPENTVTHQVKSNKDAKTSNFWSHIPVVPEAQPPGLWGSQRDVSVYTCR